jgi:hypothetical protein
MEDAHVEFFMSGHVFCKKNIYFLNRNGKCKSSKQTFNRQETNNAFGQSMSLQGQAKVVQRRPCYRGGQFLVV